MHGACAKRAISPPGSPCLELRPGCKFSSRRGSGRSCAGALRCNQSFDPHRYGRLIGLCFERHDARRSLAKNRAPQPRGNRADAGQDGPSVHQDHETLSRFRSYIVFAWDADTGLRWANSLARLRTSGKSMLIKDSLTAATAAAHGLGMVTRNRAEFIHAGVRLVDPSWPEEELAGPAPHR